MGRKENGDGVAIGIDLGTTYSCVGVWKHGRVEIITNDQGNRTTPSWVAFTTTGRQLVGDAAKNQAVFNPTNTIHDVKRLIGRKFSEETVQNDMKLWPFKVIACPDSDKHSEPRIMVYYKGEEKFFSPEDISSMILIKMKEIAEAYLGLSVKNVVITVPAYFNDSQRQATKNAGNTAGLNVLRIINEPTAAAIAYGLDKIISSNQLSKKNILVFDLGGGTFDVSLVSIDNNNFVVKAVSGDTHLGGEDFDNIMVTHFAKEFKRKHNINISDNQRALARLRTASERAKRALSFAHETMVDIDCLSNGIDFTSTITRAQFERLNKYLFKKCICFVDECLKEAKMDKRIVDDIILVGGSTQIPKIQQMLQDFFDGKKLCKSINPDEGVAYGAAIYAALMTGIVCAKKQVTVEDVTPLSLGIEDRGGELKILVPRYTSIPTKKLGSVVTTKDNQTVVTLPVYEGERPKAQDNNFLGTLTLSNITPAPARVPFLDVWMEIDNDGILTTSLEERGTKNKVQTTFRNRSRLTKEEANKLLAEVEKYQAEDEQYREVIKSRNALEGYVDMLHDTLRINGNKMEIENKTTIEDSLSQASGWLNRNCQLLEVSAFDNKLNELKSVCDPIVGRIRCTSNALDEADRTSCLTGLTNLLEKILHFCNLR